LTSCCKFSRLGAVKTDLESGGGLLPPARFFAPFATPNRINTSGEKEKKGRTMNPLIQLKKQL
jgi:hypothetical protein